MKLYKTPIAAAVSATLLALSLQAHAQTSNTTAPDTAATDAEKKNAVKKLTQLEQVIVTSSKRAQPAYKVPYNVSALTEEALRENNITDIKKLVAESEAINSPGNSARFSDNTTVRGLNTGNSNGNNIEQFVRSTLSYYLDDTPLPNIGFRIKDIARAETLIGPQGTLYGAGALGGTIRYITNEPKFGVMEGRLSTAFYNTKNGGLSNDTDAVVNIPLGENMALRASLSRLDEAGYTDRAVQRPWAPLPVWKGMPNASQPIYENDDWQKVDGGRVALRWKLTPNFILSAAHAEQKQVAHGTSGTQLFPISKNPTPGAANNLSTVPVFNDFTIISPNEEFANRKISMDNIDFDLDLGFAKLHSSTARFDDKKTGQGDYTGAGTVFYDYLGKSLNIDNTAFNGNTAFITFDNSYEGLVHETRLTSQDTGPFGWIGGVFYNKTKRSFKFSEIVPGLDAIPGATVTAVRSPNEGYRENLQSDYSETALFGELSYRVTERLTLTGGARVFSYADEGLSTIRDFTGPTSRESIVTEAQNNKSYYKLNAAYQLTGDLLTYLTRSQGYRRGGANGYRDYAGKVVSSEARAYQPDSVDNTELGVKGYVLNRDLYLQAALYQMDWKNPQMGFTQTIDDLFPINGVVNGGDIRSRGLELAARYRINDNWSVNYKGSTNSAEFVQDRVTQLYTVASDEDLKSVAGTGTWGSPKWKHFAGVRFNTSLDNGLGISASLRGRYVDYLQFSSDAKQLYPAYSLYDVNVSVSKDNWDANFWVNNLTDKRAVVSNNQGTGQGSRLGARIVYATPLTVGASLSYYFK